MKFAECWKSNVPIGDADEPIMELLREYGRDVAVAGPGPGSAEDSPGLFYRVVDGEACRTSAELCRKVEEIARWAEGVLGMKLSVAPHAGGINVNSLEPGGEYEWHRDSDRYTAIWAITDCDESTGGQLKYVPEADPAPHVAVLDGKAIRLSLRSGDVAMIDGKTWWHAVSRWHGPGARVTVPILLVDASKSAKRDAVTHGRIYSQLAE